MKNYKIEMSEEYLNKLINKLDNKRLDVRFKNSKYNYNDLMLIEKVQQILSYLLKEYEKEKGKNEEE